MYTLKGKLISKNGVQIITDKFKKRGFVIQDDNHQYPQFISLQLTQDNCDVLDKFNIGDNLTVSFNIKGRAWTSPTNETKYFNTLEAWKVTNDSGNSAEIPNVVTNSDDDDLPF